MPMTVPQDLVFAVRQFRRSPGFTLSVVLTLALGIGACTAIFSVVDGILFRPLPFPEADRLVAIATLESPTTTAATNSLAAYKVDTSYPNFFHPTTVQQIKRSGRARGAGGTHFGKSVCHAERDANSRPHVY